MVERVVGVHTRQSCAIKTSGRVVALSGVTVQWRQRSICYSWMTRLRVWVRDVDRVRISMRLMVLVEAWVKVEG